MGYSRWMLADLQVHTPADRNHRYGDVGGPDPNPDFAGLLLQSFAAAGVQIVAVTDHNRLDWWPVLRQAGEDLGVFVFPGMEFNVNKCHLLALWDRTEEGFRLAQRFLSNLFDAGVDPLAGDRTPRPVTSGSPMDLAQKAKDHQALVLAPHATAKDMGLFGKNVCNTSQQVAQSGLVSGFDVIGNSKADVLTNPRSQFGDIPPAWFISGDTRALGEVGERTVYLKVGPEPTLESLRQAFLMPGTRIRFPESVRATWEHVRGVRFLGQPTPNWDRIVRLRVEGGFHHGLDVEFGAGLNAVIGGKGTGKSTLVEVLRYALEAPASIASAAQARDGVSNREANFPSNAEATITFAGGDGQTYTVTRVGNSPGSRLFRDDLPLDVEVARRARVRVFGQRELAELHRQPTALQEFVLSHSADAVRSADQAVDEALRLAREIAGKLDEMDQHLAGTEGDAEELRDLDDRLDRLTQHGAAELVAVSEELGRAENAVQELLTWPDKVVAAIDNLRSRAQPPDVPPHDLIPAELGTVRDAAAGELSRLVQQAQASVNRLREGMVEPAGRWADVARAERERLGRELADAGLANVQELAALQRRRAELQVRVAGVDGWRTQVGQLQPLRAQALEDLGAARRVRSRLLEDAARTLTDRARSRVRVVTEPLADQGPMIEFLTKAMERRPTSEQVVRISSLTPRQVAAAIEGGRQALLDAGLTQALADRLQGLSPKERRRLEEVDTPDNIRVEIDLGTATEPRWTPLDEVSPGQAATAMLTLALVGGDEPLVIDQPEDDLDNRFIYDEIVHHIAEVNARRQIIVATHNANIPILGDADLVLALDATTGRGNVLACGGLDEGQVVAASRSILEGGIAAFESRARRYGRPV